MISMIRRVFRPYRGLRPWPRSMTEKEVVARYSRGNASLQLGLVTTAEEYEREKRDVLSFRFR